MISHAAGKIPDVAGHGSVALALGGFVDVERQWHQRMPLLRAHAIVALGALGAGLLLPEAEGDPGDGHLAVPSEHVGEDDAALVLEELVTPLLRLDLGDEDEHG